MEGFRGINRCKSATEGCHREGNERVSLYTPKVVSERREVECPNLARELILERLKKTPHFGPTPGDLAMHDVFVALAFLAMVIVPCLIATRSGSSEEKN